MGLVALRAGNWSEAVARLEDSLLYNGEDHLSWWLMALAHRLDGDASADGPELPNAHYLAPLEPALRAEAFLSQPVQVGAETSPILRSLEGDVEAWIDVACLLIDAGLYEQAARWLEEGLRQSEEPRLRYLIAYLCLVAKGMVVEARRHLDIAHSRPSGPPYPWQRTELRAIERLVADVVQSGPEKSTMDYLLSLAARLS